MTSHKKVLFSFQRCLFLVLINAAINTVYSYEPISVIIYFSPGFYLTFSLGFEIYLDSLILSLLIFITYLCMVMHNTCLLPFKYICFSLKMCVFFTECPIKMHAVVQTFIVSQFPDFCICPYFFYFRMFLFVCLLVGWLVGWFLL